MTLLLGCLQLLCKGFVTGLSLDVAFRLRASLAASIAVEDV